MPKTWKGIFPGLPGTTSKRLSGETLIPTVSQDASGWPLFSALRFLPRLAFPTSLENSILSHSVMYKYTCLFKQIARVKVQNNLLQAEKCLNVTLRDIRQLIILSPHFYVFTTGLENSGNKPCKPINGTELTSESYCSIGPHGRPGSCVCVLILKPPGKWKIVYTLR